MTHVFNNRINIRSTISVALSATMVLSLLCSLSIYAGHAELQIAETAHDVVPLQVGHNAPEFVAKSVDNKAFSFDPANLDRPVVLVSFRGGWCPFCNMHLSELRTVIPEINAMGVDVLFLSGDRPDLLFRSLKRETQEDVEDLDYQILSDAESNAGIALGIAFKASNRTIEGRITKGQDIGNSSMMLHGALSVPSVFAIDTDGVIAFAYVNADYKVRLPANELLAVAKELSE